MSSWDGLTAELDDWDKAGMIAEFWWRDDDAVEPTPALDQLLDLRKSLDVPLAIAAIPATATKALGEVLAGEGSIAVLQHGYAHRNHGATDAKQAELGNDRELWDIAREIADGRGCMGEVFGDGNWLNVMVPPWNRIDDSVTALLPGLGFYGLTLWNARASEECVPGLRNVNTHIDIIDWPGTRAYAGDTAVLDAAIGHLSAKRIGQADAGEATGLLTHHLAHEDRCWGFIETFVKKTAAHPAVSWRSAADLFPEPA